MLWTGPGVFIKTNRVKKISLLLLIAFISLWSHAQLQDEKIHDIGDIKQPDYEKLQALDRYIEGKEIVLLGEQSHLEGTTYATKYSLIKYLHEKHDFDLLVFEAEIYGCAKAWKNILAGDADPYFELARTMPLAWGMSLGFGEFTNYVKEQLEKGDTLEIAGFDSQLFSLNFKNDFEEVQALISTSEVLRPLQKQSLLESINLLKQRSKANQKILKKKDIDADTASISLLINEFPSSFEIQCLKSLKSTLSDWYLKKSYLRDRQMADNLKWLKQQYPDKKILCWGATSHFLFNSGKVHLKGFPYNIVDNSYQKDQMMGDYLRDQFGDKVYSIGFSAIEGEKGGWYRPNPKGLKPIQANSLEALCSKKGTSNYFIHLADLNNAERQLTARPIANVYMKNRPIDVMDAIIINAKMVPIERDKEMYCKVFPTNKYLCDKKQ